MPWVPGKGYRPPKRTVRKSKPKKSVRTSTPKAPSYGTWSVTPSKKTVTATQPRGSYNPSTGIYISPTGQGSSTAFPPSGAKIVTSSGTIAPKVTTSSSQPKNTYNPRTGVYISRTGQGSSVASIPRGARVYDSTTGKTKIQSTIMKPSFRLPSTRTSLSVRTQPTRISTIKAPSYGSWSVTPTKKSGTSKTSSNIDYELLWAKRRVEMHPFVKKFRTEYQNLKNQKQAITKLTPTISTTTKTSITPKAPSYGTWSTTAKKKNGTSKKLPPFLIKTLEALQKVNVTSGIPAEHIYGISRSLSASGASKLNADFVSGRITKEKFITSLNDLTNYRNEQRQKEIEKLGKEVLNIDFMNAFTKNLNTVKSKLIFIPQDSVEQIKLKQINTENKKIEKTENELLTAEKSLIGSLKKINDEQAKIQKEYADLNKKTSELNKVYEMLNNITRSKNALSTNKEIDAFNNKLAEYTKKSNEITKAWEGLSKKDASFKSKVKKVESDTNQFNFLANTIEKTRNKLNNRIEKFNKSIPKIDEENLGKLTWKDVVPKELQGKGLSFIKNGEQAGKFLLDAVQSVQGKRRIGKTEARQIKTAGFYVGELMSLIETTQKFVVLGGQQASAWTGDFVFGKTEFLLPKQITSLIDSIKGIDPVIIDNPLRFLKTNNNRYIASPRAIGEVGGLVFDLALVWFPVKKAGVLIKLTKLGKPTKFYTVFGRSLKKPTLSFFNKFKLDNFKKLKNVLKGKLKPINITGIKFSSSNAGLVGNLKKVPELSALFARTGFEATKLTKGVAGVTLKGIGKGEVISKNVSAKLIEYSITASKKVEPLTKIITKGKLRIKVTNEQVRLALKPVKTYLSDLKKLSSEFSGDFKKYINSQIKSIQLSMPTVIRKGDFNQFAKLKDTYKKVSNTIEKLSFSAGKPIRIATKTIKVTKKQVGVYKKYFDLKLTKPFLNKVIKSNKAYSKYISKLKADYSKLSKPMKIKLKKKYDALLFKFTGRKEILDGFLKARKEWNKSANLIRAKSLKKEIELIERNYVYYTQLAPKTLFAEFNRFVTGKVVVAKLKGSAKVSKQLYRLRKTKLGKAFKNINFVSDKAILDLKSIFSLKKFKKLPKYIKKDLKTFFRVNEQTIIKKRNALIKFIKGKEITALEKASNKRIFKVPISEQSKRFFLSKDWKEYNKLIKRFENTIKDIVYDFSKKAKKKGIKVKTTKRISLKGKLPGKEKVITQKIRIVEKPFASKGVRELSEQGLRNIIAKGRLPVKLKGKLRGLPNKMSVNQIDDLINFVLKNKRITQKTAKELKLLNFKAGFKRTGISANRIKSFTNEFNALEPSIKLRKARIIKARINRNITKNLAKQAKKKRFAFSKSAKERALVRKKLGIKIKQIDELKKIKIGKGIKKRPSGAMRRKSKAYLDRTEKEFIEKELAKMNRLREKTDKVLTNLKARKTFKIRKQINLAKKQADNLIDTVQRNWIKQERINRNVRKNLAKPVKDLAKQRRIMRNKLGINIKQIDDFLLKQKVKFKFTPKKVVSTGKLKGIPRAVRQPSGFKMRVVKSTKPKPKVKTIFTKGRGRTIQIQKTKPKIKVKPTRKVKGRTVQVQKPRQITKTKPTLKGRGRAIQVQKGKQLIGVKPFQVSIIRPRLSPRSISRQIQTKAITIARQNQIPTVRVRFVERLQEVERLKPRQRLKTIYKEAIIQKQREVTIVSTKIIPKVITKPRLKPLVKTGPIIVPGVKIIQKIIPKKQFIPLIPISQVKTLSFSAIAKSKGPFNVVARVKGKVRKINPFPLDGKTALAFGGNRVDNKAIRSFGIVKTKGKVRKLKTVGFKMKKFRRPKGNTKLQRFFIVEKSKFAIDTKGEKREITAKGIASKRRKRKTVKSKQLNRTKNKSSIRKRRVKKNARKKKSKR